MLQSFSFQMFYFTEMHQKKIPPKLVGQFFVGVFKREKKVKTIFNLQMVCQISHTFSIASLTTTPHLIYYFLRRT